MDCDCKDTITKKLIEVTGDPQTSIDGLLDLSNGKFKYYVTYSYRVKKRDGSFGKEKEGKLALSGCPFCKNDSVQVIKKEIGDFIYDKIKSDYPDVDISNEKEVKNFLDVVWRNVTFVNCIGSTLSGVIGKIKNILIV